MNQSILRIQVIGNASQKLVFNVLNAINRRKGNRVRQMDFAYRDKSQRGFLNVELHEPEHVLIRRISAVEGVVRVNSVAAF
ncbi:hypothetical protein BWI93_13030 [Siphonobacter sp. BAB-5385]|uniref:hypothetical protein n=1 Tax=unclassified Siphonobacter TaxID=2635712 RepID=UPI000B9E31D7|nr:MULTISPECIES: hypothetical protein [unclassified Siphonobacter]OZI07735.1 hypothetical protein BWI93_13030 [Siphonobacter sp. BAB-5385]PMD99221.1 hypothetical protein BWI97_02105 [Siphonobacter sp. BAB-5405]